MEIGSQRDPAQHDPAVESDADIQATESDRQTVQEAKSTVESEVGWAETSRAQGRDGDYSSVRNAVAARRNAEEAINRIQTRHKQLQKELAAAERDERKAETALEKARQNNDSTVEEKQREKDAATARANTVRRKENRVATVKTNTTQLLKNIQQNIGGIVEPIRESQLASGRVNFKGMVANLFIGAGKGMAIGAMIRPHIPPVVNPAAYAGGALGGVGSALTLPGLLCPTCNSVNTDTINGNLFYTFVSDMIAAGVQQGTDSTGNYAPGIGAASGLALSAMDYKTYCNAKCGICHDEWNAFSHACTRSKRGMENMRNRLTGRNQPQDGAQQTEPGTQTSTAIGIASASATTPRTND